MHKAFTIDIFFSRAVFLASLLLLYKLTCFSQCLTNHQFYQKLIEAEQSSLSFTDKFKQVRNLQKRFEQCGLNKDSVYARILHRIGVLEYSRGNLNSAINYTVQSVNLNGTGKKGINRKYVIRSYCNLGTFYKELSQYKSALTCFDSCTIEGNKHDDRSFCGYY
jgi:tetratricopeptide (TPR) repeat protein